MRPVPLKTLLPVVAALATATTSFAQMKTQGVNGAGTGSWWSSTREAAAIPAVTPTEVPQPSATSTPEPAATVVETAAPVPTATPTVTPMPTATPAAVATAAPRYVALNLVAADAFKINSSELTSASKARLARAAALLKERGSQWSKLEVVGHSDAAGQAQGKIVISQRRADAVRQALVASGIDAARITAKGLGDSELLAGIAPLDAKQRRVDLKLEITQGANEAELVEAITETEKK